MAATVKTQKARNDIYATGIQVPDAKTKTGKRRDRSKPANENDQVIVRKGETYYSWSFRFGGQYISQTFPRRSQLTQSDFWSTLYEAFEGFEMGEYNTIEKLVSAIEMLESAADDATSMCEDSMSNIPDSLQEGPVYIKLQERVDALEQFVTDISSIKDELESADLEDMKEDDADFDLDQWLADKRADVEGYLDLSCE